MKTNKIRERLNDRYTDAIGLAFKDKFAPFEIETSFNVFSMRLVSRRTDGKKLTKDQMNWLVGFSDGYANAMESIT